MSDTNGNGVVGLVGHHFLKALKYYFQYNVYHIVVHLLLRYKCIDVIVTYFL